MPTKEKLIEWKKKVDESKGALAFLSEKLQKSAEKVEAMRRAFNEKAKAMSREEIELRVAQENMLLEMRRELSETDKDVWLKDIAILQEALDDEVYIAHTVMPRPRGV